MLHGSILVAYEDGELTAARVGDHPGFIQVLLVVRTASRSASLNAGSITKPPVAMTCRLRSTLAARAVDLSPGRVGRATILKTTVACPSFYAQVVDVDHRRDLLSVSPPSKSLIEGGFAWVPPLMWRLDRAWQQLKAEAPQIKRLPSEYIREHFWITTQPMEEPPQRDYFFQLLEQMDMNDRLMFATDYPHWDFDSPRDRALPEGTPVALKHTKSGREYAQIISI